jgi:hypothetical protein
VGTAEEILDLERRRAEATNSADVEALAEILDEEYVHVQGGGTVMDKAAYLKWVGALRREHRRSNLRVVDHGEIALLVGDLENHLHEDGETRVVLATVLQAARRRDERWRFLSFQISPKRVGVHK